MALTPPPSNTASAFIPVPPSALLPFSPVVLAMVSLVSAVSMASLVIRAIAFVPGFPGIEKQQQPSAQPCYGEHGGEEHYKVQNGGTAQREEALRRHAPAPGEPDAVQDDGSQRADGGDDAQPAHAVGSSLLLGAGPLPKRKEKRAAGRINGIDEREPPRGARREV